MLFLRRLYRNFNNVLGTLRYWFTHLLKSIEIRRKFKRQGFNESYLWEAFSYLASTDMSEMMWSGKFGIYGRGNFVEFQEVGGRPYRSIISQIDTKTLKVEVYRDSKWVEVYRSHSHCDEKELKDLFYFLSFFYGHKRTKAELKQLFSELATQQASSGEVSY